MVFFELTEEHLSLLANLNFRGAFYPASDLGVFPAIDMKRLFGNGSAWMDVTEILNIKPERVYSEEELFEGKDMEGGYLYGYSPEQVLSCKLKIVELIPAMEVIFKEKTFQPGRYEMNPYGAYASYQHARNYILLHSFVKGIEEKFEMEIPQLHQCAMNLSCTDDAKVYDAFYEKLCWDNEADILEKNIGWLNYTFDELHKKMDNHKDSLAEKISHTTKLCQLPRL